MLLKNTIGIVPCTRILCLLRIHHHAIFLANLAVSTDWIVRERTPKLARHIVGVHVVASDVVAGLPQAVNVWSASAVFVQQRSVLARPVGECKRERHRVHVFGTIPLDANPPSPVFAVSRH
jgi:hypothetical protein